MAFDPDFKYEKYEEYYGDKVQVQKIIDDCKSLWNKTSFYTLFRLQKPNGSRNSTVPGVWKWK